MSAEPTSWMGWILAAVLLHSGCLARAPVPEEPPRRYAPAEIQPELGESIVSNSGLDIQNSYLSAVRVDGGRGTCSGVLIASRLVLTAGHCVCTRRALLPRGSLIDKTTCSKTALVEVVAYGSDGEASKQRYAGIVRPHAQLRILYNAENKELESTADLAVVVLEKAAQGVKPIPWATEQVRYTQAVTLVGFGKDVFKIGTDGRRRFGFNEVASIEESGETFLVGKPIRVRRPYKAKEMLLEREVASYTTDGDSGGPCLRERGKTLELVGIAKTYYGGDRLAEFSEYTSVYFYREWLRQEIANAAKASTN